MGDQQCPIWGTECESITRVGDSVIVDNSPRAGGSYRLFDDASTELGNMTENEKARLTTLLVRQHQLGNDCPPINASTIVAAKSAGRARMEERLTSLLKVLIDRTPKVGEPVSFERPRRQPDNVQSYQFALAYTESTEHREISYLANSLHDQGLIKRLDIHFPDSDGQTRVIYGSDYTVTTHGHSTMEQRQTEVKSDQCFIAMWFNEATDALYDRAIAPSVRAAGYQPLRIDQKPDFLGKIDDQIIAEIRRSRFMIADFTHGEGGVRGSVYYEVGFAQGLDIPVIFTCRDDQLDDLHFDTNHFLHLSWPRRHAEALIEPLKNRILANIGEGPHAG